MKYLILLLLLSSCAIESITPECNYDLTDKGEKVEVRINSAEPQVELSYLMNDEWILTVINKHYYLCLSITRTSYPMRFRVNGCEQMI